MQNIICYATLISELKVMRILSKEVGDRGGGGRHIGIFLRREESAHNLLKKRKIKPHLSVR